MKGRRTIRESERVEAKLQWLKFSLSFCGDLLCLVLRSLGNERDSVAKERIIHNMTDMKTFKSIVADEEKSVNAIRKKS